MRDLRSLPPEVRQKLMDEAERQARAGEQPSEICKRLEVTPRTYRAWAERGGFRQKDLSRDPKPECPTARSDTPLDPIDPIAILEAVREALAAGDRAAVDRLIAGWKRETRRSRDLAALEAVVAAEHLATEPASVDVDALALEVSNLIKRPVRVRK